MMASRWGRGGIWGMAEMNNRTGDSMERKWREANDNPNINLGDDQAMLRVVVGSLMPTWRHSNHFRQTNG